MGTARFIYNCFLHEIGHALAAQFFQWKINRIMILPFGGFCEVDEHGNRPIKEELIIILAGPCQHLLIALVIFVLKSLALMPVADAEFLIQCNWMILLFNLLPIWPLDGGKLIQLYLASTKPYLEAQRQSLISSFIALLMLHGAFLFVAPLQLQVWAIFIYLYFCLYMQWRQRRYAFMRFLLERYYGKHQAFKQLQPITAQGDDFLYTAMEKFQRNCKHFINVSGKNSLFGKLDENELLYAYFTEKQVHAQFKDIVYHD
ncbi:M50 family metallopeptidase [Bacillus sp. N9]